MIQVIILKANKKRHLTFTFSSFEIARKFVSKYDLEDQVVDIY